MAKEHYPTTPAVRLLQKAGVDFVPHLYPYEERGGTAVSARELGIPETRIIKTLVMEDDRGEPFLILMHGDREVSTKELARLRGVKSVQPCPPEKAQRLTGYLVGGTSPFATRRPLSVYLEETIEGLTTLLINGGKRGFLVEIRPEDLTRILQPVRVRVARGDRSEL